MAESVGRIQLDMGINYNSFRSQLLGMAGRIGGILAAAFSIQKLVNFGKASIELASDLEEVQNVVDVTFGEMAGYIDKFAKSAMQNFGLSELSAKRFTSTLGAMLKSAGITGNAVVKMSTELTKLAADMASFYNLDHETAFQKIRAGISGETEPLKQLGINLSVANLEHYALSKGINKSYNEMTQAEQILLRYNYLLEVTKDAQGDFARTSGSWANQIALLREQWRSLMTTMGQAFINIFTPIVRGLNYIIKRLQVAAAYFKAFIDLIFGKREEDNAIGKISEDFGGAAIGAEKATEAIGGVGKATKKAAKEAKGALAPFDEINVLMTSASKAAGGVADGVGGAAAADFGNLGELEELEKVDLGQDKIAQDIEILINNFKRLKNFLGEYFAPEIEYTKQIFTNLWQEIVNTFNRIRDYAVERLTPLKEVFINIGLSLIEGLRKIYSPIMELFNNLILIILPIFEGMSTTIIGIFASLVEGIGLALQPAIELISEIIKTILDSINEFFDKHLNEIRTKILDIWETIRKGIENIIGVISNNIREVFDGLLNWWKDNSKNVKNTLLNTWNTIYEGLKVLWDIIKDIAENLFGNIAKFFEENSDEISNFIISAWNMIYSFVSTIWTWLVETGKKLFNDLKAFWDKWGDDILNIFDICWKLISDLFGDTLKILSHLFNIFAALFKGDWKTLWEEVKKLGSALWEGIKNLLSNTWNVISSIANTIWKGIKEKILSWWENIRQGIINTKDKLINAIKSPFETVKNWINNIIKDAFNWGKNLINSFVDGIKSMINSVKNAARNVANSISNFLGFHSPTKEGPGSDADKWAPNLMNMFAQGIYDNLGKIKTAVMETANIINTLSNVQLSTPALAAVGGYNVNTSTQDTKVIDNLANKLLSAIRTIQTNTVATGGDVYVYIGDEQIEAYIYKSQERRNIRSNGRL